MNSTAAIAVSVLAGLVWYAVVEATYFGMQGKHFRTVFAAANRVSPASAFEYRGAPWVAVVAYTVLLTSLALLAVVPAVRNAMRSHGKTKGHRVVGAAYLCALWRAVLLCAAVYVTYDLTTYATVHAFGLRTAGWDMAYGIIAVPVAIVAPVAALAAYLLSPSSSR